MDSDQIFIFDNMIEQNHQNSIQLFDLPNSDLFLKKGDSQKYVDQFLNHLSNKVCEKTRDKLPQTDNKQNCLPIIFSKQNITPSSNQEQISEPQSSQINSHSVFHNFQKHLTIFLRSILKPDQIKLLPLEPEASSIAKDLWKVFCKSTINAKRIIHSVLGQFDPKGKQKELKQLGLKEIYNKNQIQKINKGKQIIRDCIKIAIEKTNLQEYLNRTRIKNKQYFQLYLKEFIQQLHQGVFKRRIRRDRVLKNIN